MSGSQQYLEGVKLKEEIMETCFKVTGNENDLVNSNRSFEKITKHKGLSVGGNQLSSSRFSEPSKVYASTELGLK